MKGYKVFNPDFKSKHGSEVFSENAEFKMDAKPNLCNTGYHFCVKASHCFDYYSFDSNNIVCEVEALGEIHTQDGENKHCTNHIRIGRRLTWSEVLAVANEGSNNTGHSNTGNRNTGNRNTGNRNTGDWNTGYRNTGDWNTGDWNTGDRNTGYSNTGDWNTGDRNTGYRNTGDWNTGNRNTGYRNTGDWNTGDRNTGYSNTGNRNTGGFCTGEAPFPMFNKASDWTEKKFQESRAYRLLCEVDTKLWVPEYKMTDDEKAANRGWKTADGFYRDIPYKQAFSDKWANWNEENRNAFKSLPNFDAEIFFEITGVRV